jgi:hypothetical protein
MKARWVVTMACWGAAFAFTAAWCTTVFGQQPQAADELAYQPALQRGRPSSGARRPPA